MPERLAHLIVTAGLASGLAATSAAAQSRGEGEYGLMVDAPGGNRAVWEFDTISNGEQVQIGLGPSTPSQLVLPVIPGIEPPAEYPACGSLRGQPCR